jgi:hypothetical protein
MDIERARPLYQAPDHSLIAPHAFCLDIQEALPGTALCLDISIHRPPSFAPRRQVCQEHMAPHIFL